MADKYSMISFVPSMVIVSAMVVGSFVAIYYLRKCMAKDAAKATERVK
ncbi:hypothetical protein Q4508_02630 [Amphritea sp. 2_MG-2023]|jgi:hypothetical protein|nr:MULTISPECIES: hypothetical protein [Amphritea]MBU2966694.1 hypothetical protein [Amphritea atlantica]MDO6417447.1 hypothetical protein [Amphritea sp. 2_MG-2023]MDX2421977.1 hypothetical protein [Amphritea sp.]